MRSIILNTTEPKLPPFALNIAQVVQQIEEEIPALNDDTILVRLVFVPIHPYDLLIASGLVTGRVPRQGGFEASGVVQAVGGNVQRFGVGDRVVVSAFKLQNCTHPEQSDEGEMVGLWSEFVVCTEDHLLAVPEGVTMEVAAQMFANPVTALAAIDNLGVKEGDWIAINAGSSTLARCVNLIAAHMGINVITIIRNAEQIPTLVERGIPQENIVVVNNEQNPIGQIRALSQGGLNGAIDLVAGNHTEILIFSMRPSTRILSIGTISGNGINISDVSLTGYIITFGIELKGFSINIGWQLTTDDTHKRTIYDKVYNLVKEGILDLTLTRPIFPLEDIANAIIASSTNAITGKVLVSLQSQLETEKQ